MNLYESWLISGPKKNKKLDYQTIEFSEKGRPKASASSGASDKAQGHILDLIGSKWNTTLESTTQR